MAGIVNLNAEAQDVAVTASLYPSDGCDLTNSEQVGVVILNNSGVFIPSNTIEVSYTVDGAGLQQQLLGTNLNGGATWNFTFNINGDLSACGPRELKVWVEYASDPNQANDTLTWTVQNDCTVIPGEVDQDMLVCELGNNDTLELINSQYGYIDDWEYSEDNGTSWNSIGVSDSTYEFFNLTTETQFRVILDGGFCPNDTALFATVSLQPEPTGGTITGANSVCAANSSGTLEVTGNSGAVIQWESTNDNGNTWNNIANTNTTETYTGLTQTTWYRVLIDGGVCPDVYSDTAIIFVETTTIAGTLEPDTTICPGESVDLILLGNLGAVQFWESSQDGNTWNNITNTTVNHTTGPVNTETYFRVIVQNGICPQDTSNRVFVELFPLPFVNAGNDVVITEGDTTQLSGLGGVTGIWTPGASMSDSTIQTPDAFPVTTTTYTYTVISEDGCFSSDQVLVTVEPFIPPPPPIPPFDVKNTLTPNDDGFNDTWIIEGIEAFPQTIVTVYNIYGKEIYSNNDYQNEWDGTFNGNPLPDGTYMYVVTPGGTDAKLKGNLTIFGNE